MWNIICEFDHTIALGNTTLDLLARFADPSWQGIERRRAAGLIGPATCLQMQIALLRVRREPLDEAIDELPIDPHFAAFARGCIADGHRLTIAGDALEYVVRRVLQRLGLAGLDIDVVANHVRATSEQTYELLPPHVLEGCGRSVCKCMAVKPGQPMFLIGTDRLDYCAAMHAKVVIARGELLVAARQAGKDNVQPFRDFADVARTLAAIRQRAAAQQAARARSAAAVPAAPRRA